jgi:hypothetical protein
MLELEERRAKAALELAEAFAEEAAVRASEPASPDDLRAEQELETVRKQLRASYGLRLIPTVLAELPWLLVTFSDEAVAMVETPHEALERAAYWIKQ